MVKDLRNFGLIIHNCLSKWGGTIIYGLVRVDAFRAQQQSHTLGMTFLTCHEKWRGTIIHGLVHNDAFLAQE